MSTTPRYVYSSQHGTLANPNQLWMGTHPTNPSKIYGTDQLLSAYLSDKKDLLGAAAGFEPPFDGHKAEEGHVPFLFKILCANQGQQSFQKTRNLC
jgi:mannose-6-phosphate isomerase class I